MKNKAIINKIQELKKISPRSKWVTLNRDFLLQEIKADAQLEPVGISWRDYNQVFIHFFGQRVFQPAVIMLLMLGVFLGSSLVINAAFYSLPGDPLYRVKIALEKTQLAVTPGEEKKVELKIEFTKNRVKEFDKIVQQADVNPEVKKEKLNAVARELKSNIIAVKQHVESKQQLSEADKEKTLRIAVTVSSETNDLAQELDRKVNNLSAIEKSEVGEILTEAVAEMEETNVSAQVLIDQSQKIEEKGAVKGAENTSGVTDGQATNEGVVDSQEGEAQTTTGDNQTESNSASNGSVPETTQNVINN